MEWNGAQQQIQSCIKVGSDLNSARSTFRFVKSTDSVISNRSYGYRGERGFIVSIGRTVTIQIPWSLLRECFTALSTPSGYSGAFFRKQFPKQARDHPCHVHVVGQIFVRSGIARTDGERFWSV